VAALVAGVAQLAWHCARRHGETRHPPFAVTLAAWPRCLRILLPDDSRHFGVVIVWLRHYEALLPAGAPPCHLALAPRPGCAGVARRRRPFTHLEPRPLLALRNPLKMKRDTLFFGALLVGTAFLFIGASAHAQATIDQTKALAGNALPGDAPGFPVTISQRGSYKLTSNLVVPAGVGGILVTASDVSIDLNGFAITGANTCSGFGATVVCTHSGSAAGIEAAAGVTDVQVRNGAVDGFEKAGMWLNQRSTIDRVKARFNSGYAIVVRADSSVGNSVVERNLFGGVFIEGGMVFDTIASGNRDNGIVVYNTADGALLRNNVAAYNGLIGLKAEALRVTFMDNQANKNGGQNAAYNPATSAMLPGNVCNGGAC